MATTKKIGLVGFGTVGEGLYRLLRNIPNPPFEIKTIVVKQKGKTRILPDSRFSYNVNDVLNDSEIDIIVELIDDAEAAFELVSKALSKGIDVVSANKKMIANNLPALAKLQNEFGSNFRFEAAVGGTIPILNTLDSYLTGDNVQSIKGILNGTSNYILTSMANGESYTEALRNAQLLGFAEADPTLDVGGFDAKYKLVIMRYLATGQYTSPDDVFNGGIGAISNRDIAWGSNFGYTIKPIVNWSVADKNETLYSLPSFLNQSETIAGIHKEENALEINTENSGRYFLAGAGAGAKPTAHAVWSDLNALILNHSYTPRDLNENLEKTGTSTLALYIRSENESFLHYLNNVEVVEKSNFGGETTWVVLVSSGELNHLTHVQRKEAFIAVLPENHVNEQLELFIDRSTVEV